MYLGSHYLIIIKKPVELWDLNSYNQKKLRISSILCQIEKLQKSRSLFNNCIIVDNMLSTKIEILDKLHMI